MTASSGQITHRWLARALLLGLLLAVLPTSTGQRALAQDGLLGAESIRAVVGFDGVLPNAPHVPLVVTLSPDRPIRGRLIVASETNGGQNVERRDVEVGAGGVKVFRFLVPTGFGIGVQFVADGDDTATTIRPQVPFTTSAIVAGLGTDAQGGLPAGLSLPVIQRSVDRVAFDPAWLELGPATLAGIGTLVTTQADLAALSADSRATLDHAVVQGLQLVVAEVTAPDLGLAISPVVDVSFTPAPTAWTASSQALTRARVEGEDAADADAAQPESANVARITQGRGEIVAMAGRSADPVLLGAVLRQRDARERVRQLDLPFLQNRVVGQSLTGGITGLPPVWVLALVMGLYILLVGPLNALALKLVGRMEWAWVTVPVVTLVFVVGAAAFARGSGASNGVQQHAAVWLDGAGTETTTLAMSSSNRGQIATSLPGNGWTIDTLGFVGGVVVERRPDRIDATVPVATRESAGLVARRPIDTPAPLDVEAAILEGVLRLEITNNLEVPVDQVLVRVAGFDQRLAGRIEPGATLTDVVELPSSMPQVPSVDTLLNRIENLRFGGEDMVFPAQPFPDGMGQDGFGLGVDAAQVRPIDNGITSSPARQAFVDFGVLSDIDPLPGVVWIIADAPAGSMNLAAATVGGRAAAQDTAVLAVGVTPSATDTDTSPYETPLRVMDLVDGVGISSAPTRVFGDGTLLLAFDLPREAQLGDLDVTNVVKPDAFQDQFGGFGFGGFEGDMMVEQGFAEVAPMPLEAFTVEEDVALGQGGFAEGELSGEDFAQDGQFCVFGQETDANGIVTGDFEECGSENPVFDCPPDAVSCEVNGDSSTVCFNDGRCIQRFTQSGPGQFPIDPPFPVPVPLPPDVFPPDFGGFGQRIEVWDPDVQNWTPIEDLTLASTFADPFGRVVVRLLDTFEIDLSGRGLGAGLTTKANP